MIQKPPFPIDMRVAHERSSVFSKYNDVERRYRITWVSGKMAPKDHDRIAWVSPDKLLEYDLLPADIPIAQECKKRINSR